MAVRLDSGGAPSRPRDSGKGNPSTGIQRVGNAVASVAQGVTSNRAPAKTQSTPNVGRSNTAGAPSRSGSNYSGAPSRSGNNYSGSSGGSSGGGSYSGGGASYGSSGGGGGTDFSGSGGGTDFGAASFAAPAPVMQDITIPDPLENATYQKQKSELARARADFDAQQQLARSQYNASFDDAQRQLGWRASVPRVGAQALLRGAGNDGAGFDPNSQGTAYGDAYQGNQGDFAGRGLYNSGMYAPAVSNMNQLFNDRRGTALRDQKSYMDTQDLNKQNFYGQQDSADLAAREDAINSIISQYGVSRDQVTPGRQNTIQRLSGV